MKNVKFVIWVLSIISLNTSCNLMNYSNESPDVYFVGYDGHAVVYWKNGKEYTISSEEGITITSMAVSKSDFYIAGSKKDTPIYWKNGILHKLPKTFDSYQVLSMVIFHSDVYFAGFGQSNHVYSFHPVYWKNDIEYKLNCTSNLYYSTPYCITIDGLDLYFAGYATDSITFKSKPIYWKNGILNSWDTHSEIRDITGMAINNQDIYFVGTGSKGESYLHNETRYAIYWKNGFEHILPSTSYSYYTNMNSIFIVDSNVYISGWGLEKQVGSDEISHPIYWKNGKEYKLPSITDDSQEYTMSILGSDVYFAGVDGNVPVYWKNGIESSLPHISNKSFVKLMAIDN